MREKFGGFKILIAVPNCEWETFTKSKCEKD